MLILFFLILSVNSDPDQLGELILNREDFVLVLLGEVVFRKGDVLFFDVELVEHQVLDVLLDQGVFSVEIGFVV